MGDAPYGGPANGKVSVPAPGGSGGFEFDADKLGDIIKKWQDLHDDLLKDKRDAELMAGVKAPGKEFASGDWEKRANPSGKAFLEQNGQMLKYVEDYITALQNAQKKITTNEADTRAGLAKTGNQAT
ncbi:hypothetical protein [Amycolatopsis anabasis]|uniref:hypothetical protein n=1 Tax=Amycolatopsis anabasis TaxID=1840409 RepID=UPI00131DE78E|nr:hypothetical protein [Amycolatopsis anabasis]